jgi:hypothetical protein
VVAANKLPLSNKRNVLINIAGTAHCQIGGDEGAPNIIVSRLAVSLADIYKHYI